MERIPLEQRRAILTQKLRGASNREAATEVGVSKGTVANVLDAARDGEFSEFADLESQVDALVALSKRLDDEGITVTAAHAGLDLLSWLAENDVDPADLDRLRNRLSDVETGDQSIESYVDAAVTLNALETETGFRVGGRLNELIGFLGARDKEKLDNLWSLVSALEQLDAEIDDVDAAVTTALDLQEFGFDVEVARRLAAELADIDQSPQAEVISSVGKIYADYRRLGDAIEERESKKQRLDAEIEALDDERAELNRDRERLRQSISELETSHATLENVFSNLEDGLASTENELDRRRTQLEGIEAEYREQKEQLEAIQAEREAVHAYRRFLRDNEVPDNLLTDVENLLQFRRGTASSTVETFAPDIQDRTETNLRVVLNEMLEGEEMIPRAEHERKLREKGHIERNLEELQTERDAIAAFLRFLDTGDVSKDVLQELLRAKRGMGTHLESRIDRKTEEVRGYLIEQLTALTDGREVVDKTRHSKRLQECRDRYIAELQRTTDSIAALTEQIQSMQSQRDDQRIAEVIVEMRRSLDDLEDPPSVDDLTDTVQEAFVAEIEHRVALECERRINDAYSRGLEIRSSDDEGAPAPNPREE